MEMEANNLKNNGKPKDDSYLEYGIPKDLKASIEELKQAPNASLRSLLREELYGDINMALHCDEISDECAKYLRRKYLVYD